MLRRITIALLLLASVSVSAMADVWDPPWCLKVHPWDELGGAVVSPENGTPLTASIITILLFNQECVPVTNAQVVVLFTAANPVCPNAVLTATTDSAGQCTMSIAAGGCANGIPFGCVIKANGVTIRSYSKAKSPDWNGAQGDGVVNLSDLIAFAREFNGVDPAACHDYTNDTQCNLSDLTIFGEAFSHALHCQ